MADDYAIAAVNKRLNDAVGTGRIYTVLGILMTLALIVTVAAGFYRITGPGLFIDQTAFAVGGIAIVVIAGTVLIMTFSLNGTIRYMRRELEDLTRLRENIEESYSKLRDSANHLGREVGSLRVALQDYRKSLARERRGE